MVNIRWYFIPLYLQVGLEAFLMIHGIAQYVV